MTGLSDAIRERKKENDPEVEPVAPNDTEANMAHNRRVEIVFLED